MTAEALVQMKRTEQLGAYKPSTLIDFEAGKPLEIEAIWGEPLRRAQAAGADVPRLAALYEELKQLDRIGSSRRPKAEAAADTLPISA